MAAAVGRHDDAIGQAADGQLDLRLSRRRTMQTSRTATSDRAMPRTETSPRSRCPARARGVPAGAQDLQRTFERASDQPSRGSAESHS